MILKYLSENSLDIVIKGIFLLATPFWSGTEEWQIPLHLNDNFAELLPGKVPVFFYHCQDDEEVPFSHLSSYRAKIPQATFHVLKSGGHQLNTDAPLVAKDIQSLYYITDKLQF